MIKIARRSCYRFARKSFRSKARALFFFFSFLNCKKIDPWKSNGAFVVSFRRNATRSLDCGGKSRGKFFAEEVFSKERERKNNFHSVTGG